MKTTTRKTTAKIGAGLATASAVAAAGYYFYGSKEAKKHRKVAVKWANDMKKEAERFEKANPEIKRTVRTIVSRVKKAVKNRSK